ncbi:hypothetical protein [Nocardia sp. NPDC051981]|uniref:hypothetical protein n=1 Tax=Nocardia sp. NPDC051981 TaxID=3155417 RepID=UPI0034418FF0
MTAQTTAAWPTNVFARYLTVAGSSLGRDDLAVDLTHRLTIHNPPEPFATLATCTGCQATEEASHWRSHYPFAGALEEKHEPEAADKRAREWAQAHAEKCRAMPKPTS